MGNVLIGYKPCSTCRNAEKLLREKGITYDYREITDDTPTAGELMSWYEKSKLNSIKKMMNTSGTKYRELNLKEKLQGLDDMQQFEMIAQDGMLIKRPILLIGDSEVYVGKEVHDYLSK